MLKIINARIAFIQNLWEAAQIMGEGEKKYSATFLLPKDNTQLQRLRGAMVSVAVEKWGNKGKDVLDSLISKDKVFLRDGNDKSQYDGFEGNMYFNATQVEKRGAPVVVNMDKVNITEADGLLYAGCYVDVSIDIYAQDNTYGKRINAVLRAVRFRAEGEALAGTAPANENEFDDISDVGVGTVKVPTNSATVYDGEESLY